MIFAASLFALLLANADVTPSAEYTAPPPADCTVVDTAEASSILGYPVQTPDDASRTGGICFFVSQAVSQDGTLTYAVVTEDWLPLRQAFNRRLARRCPPVLAGSSNEFACKQFIALAGAADIKTYYAARASAPDAKAVAGLGDEAVEAGNALYVHRGDEVFEMSVLRGGDYDSERTARLAAELLSRVK